MESSLRVYKSSGYRDFELRNPGFDQVWDSALYTELYPDYASIVDEIKGLIISSLEGAKPKILDSCCGSGFISKDLALAGLNMDFADKNPAFGASFIADLNAQLSTNKKIIKASWDQYSKEPLLPENHYNFVMCRGNSFIYASGDINSDFHPDFAGARQRYVASLRGMYGVMQSGGFLYLDKYKDEEEPFECTVGYDLSSGKDIVWYCHRKPDLQYREASIGLADDPGVYMHYCDDLDEALLQSCAQKVGFQFRKITLKHEKNFAVYLLQKP